MRRSGASAAGRAQAQEDDDPLSGMECGGSAGGGLDSSPTMISFRFLVVTISLTMAAVLATSRAAYAQDGAANDGQSTDGPGIAVKWNNGIDVSTTDGANELQLGALLQVDGRFAPD